MAVVAITVDGQKYNLSCDDGQEARLLSFGQMLDKKASMIRRSFPQIADNMLLVMVGVLMAEEISLLKEGKTPVAESGEIPPNLLEQLENIAAKIDSLADSL